MKRNVLAAAITMGLSMGAFAGTQGDIANDGANCQDDPFQGLGDYTCMQPDPTRGEGLTFVAAETAVSIASAIADSLGCAGSFKVDIDDVRPSSANNPGSTVDNDGLQWAAVMKLGTASLSNPQVATIGLEEKGYDNQEAHGVRHYLINSTNAGGDSAKVLGLKLAGLVGEANTDYRFSILFGGADFSHGSADLDERYIKDFYKGNWVFPTYIQNPDTAAAPCPPAVLAGTPATNPAQPNDAQLFGTASAPPACLVSDPGTGSDNDPRKVVRTIRDNGLEVTTKKHFVPDLDTNILYYQASHPKGKWRQISFYREPDGAGHGELIYTKVKIAPYGDPECALQLSGDVTGTRENPHFSGTVRMFPLGI